MEDEKWRIEAENLEWQRELESEWNRMQEELKQYQEEASERKKEKEQLANMKTLNLELLKNYEEASEG